MEGGNVGIGSVTPGQALDVNGTVRMTGFSIISGAGTGKVLTSDSSGNGTWAVNAAASNYWINDGGNVGINTAYSIGIGTISQIMPSLDAEPMHSMEQISKRWGCHYATVYRRLMRHKAKVYRFSSNAIRVPLSEILRIESEAEEILA